ncbi:MAG TPA: carboxypeptidase-like regulatory domain-containing protein, partial [Gemmatimonadaceae bacterium]
WVVRASAPRDPMRAIVLLLGLVLTTGVVQAQGTAVLSGTVRDEAGAPIRQALIVIDPDSLSLRTRSDADGRYRITVPRGRYEIRIVRIGHRPLSRVIDVNAEQVTFDPQLPTVPIPLDNVTVRVSRPGLYGRVVSRGIELLPHEPTPVRAANIQVLNEPYRVNSDSDGRFSIPELAIGSHSILVVLDHYVTRLIAVTVPPEGGVEITVTLDSLYAEYQHRDERHKREIAWRLSRAGNPATFVSAHELDPAAKDLREALRYAPSLLTRGVNVMDPRVRPVIYIDGQLTNLHFPDLKAEDIAQFAGIEVYPNNTLSDAMSVPGSSANIGFLDDGALFSSGRGAPGFSNRTAVRTRGNSAMLIMIWTTRRR